MAYKLGIITKQMTYEAAAVDLNRERLLVRGGRRLLLRCLENNGGVGQVGCSAVSFAFVAGGLSRRCEAERGQWFTVHLLQLLGR
ncbi:GCN5 family acetyltransferase [Sesbania bispinosa]|nr:GCN5 family acetyltransferase [Sesbania bispinosa]